MRHNFDLICLSETYVTSSIQHKDKRLDLHSYKLARPDNSENSKK